MDEFPALMEKLASLENQLGQRNAEIDQLRRDLHAHTGDWSLTVRRDGNLVGEWSLPSNGDFDWEGDGLQVELRSAKG